MTTVALICLSVLVFPWLIARAEPIAKRTRSVLTADELRLCLMILGIGWFAFLLVLFSLGTQIPSALFIYGRF